MDDSAFTTTMARPIMPGATAAPSAVQMICHSKPLFPETESDTPTIVLSVVFGLIGLGFCMMLVYFLAEKRLLKKLQNGPEEQLAERLRKAVENKRFSLR
jgi:hypothetical protein